MTLSVQRLTRDFQTPFDTSGLTYNVRSLSAKAMGGPHRAAITLTGRNEALWGAVEMLRAPITVRDIRQEPVWWGYLSEINLPAGQFTVGIRLDEMFNSVAVAYSHLETGGTTISRATTPFANHDSSVTVYGLKELLQSAGDKSHQGALNLRNTILEEAGLPIPIIGKSGERSGTGTAMVYCRGWWDTLAWRYYKQTSGRETHDSGSLGSINVGDISERILAQSFSLSNDNSWEVANIILRCQKIGTPADGLRVKLAANNAGVPGTVLESSVVAAGDIQSVSSEIVFAFNMATTLVYGTTYWLVVERTGVADMDDYYRVSFDDTAGYANGALYIDDDLTTGWEAHSPAADLTFVINGAWETSHQLEAMVNDLPNNFITAVRVVPTGVWSNQFRNGDSTTFSEVDDLLREGTSNNRRLLATISQERILTIYEEPAKPSSNWHRLFSNGRLEDAWGLTVPPEALTAGVWAKLVDIIPATANVTAIANPSEVFIESAEFDRRTGKTFYRPRGRQNPLEATKLGGYYA